MGLHRLRQGRVDEARNYLENVVIEHANRINIAAIGGSWLGLAGVHLERGDCANAEAALGKAMEIARRGDNVLFECWVLPVLAELHLRLGDNDGAARTIGRGFKLLAPAEDWRGLPAPLHLARAMRAVRLRRWDEAEHDFETARAINHRYELPFDEARTLAEWGGMYLSRGTPADRERARERLVAALAMFERIGAVNEVGEVRTILEPLRA